MNRLRISVALLIGALVIMCGVDVGAHAQTTGGKEAPATPPEPSTPPAEPTDQPDDDIDAEKVYFDFLDAVGGRARVEAIASVYSQIRIDTRNQSMVVETHWQRDRAFRVEYEAMGVVNQGGSDAAVSWMYQSNRGYTVLSAQAAALMYERANRATMLFTLRDDYEKMRYIGRDTFRDRPAYRIELTGRDDKLSFIFFDRETKLPLGIRWSEEGPMGEFTTELLFQDWEEFGEFRSWTRLVMSRLGTEQSMYIELLEFNKVAPEIFELPDEVRKLVAEQAANPPATVEPAPAPTPVPPKPAPAPKPSDKP